jgi:hypothetical protein
MFGSRSYAAESAKKPNNKCAVCGAFVPTFDRRLTPHGLIHKDCWAAYQQTHGHDEQALSR